MVGMPTNFQMDHDENVIMQLNSLYVMDRESEMSESNNLDMDFPFKQKKNKKNNRNCVERENTFLLQNMRECMNEKASQAREKSILKRESNWKCCDLNAVEVDMYKVNDICNSTTFKLLDIFNIYFLL